MNQPKSNALEQRLAKLFSRINYESQSRMTARSFKLHGMRDLLERIGNPHLKYPVIHVAGTKGKGSVTTMIGSVLSMAGLKTGVYTSPHLETIHQRMAIDGLLIDDDQLIEVLDQLQPVLAEMDHEATQQNRRKLTFFEVTTAAMFCHFANQKVDAAIIEVGLGGRLDSTNVCQPTVCVITNISFDHTKQLGNTLDAIAREKAGIIKSGIPVVSGAVNPDAAAVITTVAASNNAELFVLDKDFFVAGENTDCDERSDARLGRYCKNKFSFSGILGQTTIEIRDLELSLLGFHQVTNAALAVVASTLFAQAERRRLVDDDIRRGLASAHLMGRTETICVNPMVVVDMAHNVASIAALIDTLTTQLPGWHVASSKRLIVAISRDKDARGMLRSLIRHFDEVVFTRYLNNPRGKSPDELLEIAVYLRDQMNLATVLSVDPNPQSAWRSMREKTDSDGIICISGSAFLVAELRQTVLDSEPIG